MSTQSPPAPIPADKYLDGLVAAISRVGVMITTLGIISGLILVVWYVDNFSFDEPQHAVAKKAAEMYQARILIYDAELKSGHQAGRLVALSEIEATKAVEDASHYRSLLYYKVATINNEMQKVSLGRVKLPILNHEVPTNDASVVLSFFLVIISIVTLITVRHINDALDDRRLLRMVRQNMVLLRSRLILIYAPITGRSSAIWIWLIFFMPCIAAVVTFGETMYYFRDIELFVEYRMWETARLRAILLGLMTLFLGYVGFALLVGWQKLSRALAE